MKRICLLNVFNGWIERAASIYLEQGRETIAKKNLYEKMGGKEESLIFL